MMAQPQGVNWIVVSPQLTLVIAGVVVMLMETFSTGKKRGHLAYMSLMATLVFAYFTFSLWGLKTSGFSEMIRLDPFALFLNAVIALGTALTILLSVDFVKRENIPQGEYYSLILFSATGMSLLASGSNLLVLFLAIEIMSISLYVLTTIVRTRLTANEAALKYFLLGAFASGFLLYGIALLYGLTGTSDIVKIGMFIKAHSLSKSPMLLLAFSLTMVGLAFKVALVPFHMWTPDVYQGAPSTITAFMATGVKAAAFAAILRLFVHGFFPLEGLYQAVFWILALLTMTLGNVVALVQDNIKRMLAYSSIAHAGYICIAIVVGTPLAYSAMLFYLAAYTLMNVGAFAVVILIERKGDERLNISDYRGLSERYPLLALAMAVFMFSLGGIPPTAGFIGKFYLFSEAVKSGFIGLAIIGVLNSVVSVYYYLRVVVSIYMTPAQGDAPEVQFNPNHTVATAIAALCIILLGIWPAPLLHFAGQCFYRF